MACRDAAQVAGRNPGLPSELAEALGPKPSRYRDLGAARPREEAVAQPGQDLSVEGPGSRGCGAGRGAGRARSRPGSHGRLRPSRGTVERAGAGSWPSRGASDIGSPAGVPAACTARRGQNQPDTSLCRPE
jgi:hypothetical protein